VNESLSKRRRRSVVRDILHKTLDCCIVAGVVTGIFVGYAGHYWTAISIMGAVLVLASFRFFDQEAASTPAGVSDELDQDLPPDELHHYDDSPGLADSSDDSN
jgi:hypothetical protein